MKDGDVNEVTFSTKFEGESHELTVKVYDGKFPDNASASNPPVSISGTETMLWKCTSVSRT